MDRLGKNLQVLFLEIPPERLIESLNQPFSLNKKDSLSYASSNVSEEIFCRYSGNKWNGWSEDENILTFQAMKKDICEIINSHNQTTCPVLWLPVLCGTNYLIKHRGQLACRFEKVNDWREAYHSVGQDLITTAYLALNDLQNGFDTKNFSWNAVLNTNQCELNTLLQRGIAENHFHLKGSTQSFPLTWCCLMNFPDHAASIMKNNFKINRYIGISRGEQDNVLPHHKRVLIAASIRLSLYMAMRGIVTNAYETFINQQNTFLSFSGVNNIIEKIRYMYGFKNQFPGDLNFCLDLHFYTF